MVQTWLTADLHINHSKIIQYCNRPFKNVDDMNKKLIKNWNNRVKKDDIVYHVGDFCFREHKDTPKAEHWIKQLNGRIIFINGNHDEGGRNTLKTDIHSVIIKKGKRYFYLVHDPKDAENFDINIVGHVHKEWKFKTEKWSIGQNIDLINVGTDMWNYAPVSYDQMMKEYNKWKKNLLV